MVLGLHLALVSDVALLPPSLDSSLSPALFQSYSGLSSTPHQCKTPYTVNLPHSFKRLEKKTLASLSGTVGGPCCCCCCFCKAFKIQAAAGTSSTTMAKANATWKTVTLENQTKRVICHQSSDWTKSDRMQVIRGNSQQDDKGWPFDSNQAFYICCI